VIDPGGGPTCSGAGTAALGETILMSGPLADLRAAYPPAQIFYHFLEGAVPFLFAE